MQPFLIVSCIYALCILLQPLFVAYIFVGFCILSGVIAAMQFVGLDVAWEFREQIGSIQGDPEDLKLLVTRRERPVGLSLTPIHLSYQIVLALIMIGLLRSVQRVKQISYRYATILALVGGAVSGNRSLLLAVVANEFIANLVKRRGKSIPMLIGLVTMVGLGAMYLTTIGSRVVSIGDGSALGRPVLAKLGLYLAMDNPFGFGWGFDSRSIAWLYWSKLNI